MASITVIGIGNRYRRDDAVGLRVVDALRNRFNDAAVANFVTTDGNVSEVLDALENCDVALLIDALAPSAGKPGAILTFDLASVTVNQALFHGSTHAIGVAEAIELASALGVLPEKIAVWGVVGASFEMGTELSPAVALAVTDITERLSQHLTIASPSPG